MKRLLLLCLVGLVSDVFALRPGDAAEKFEAVRWLRGGGVVPSGVSQPRNSDEKGLRAIVFLFTRAVTTPETMRMLDALRVQYGDRLKIAVITPDPQPDAEEFLKTQPKDGVSFGLDLERRITPRYMAGSLLYPMAFLIDDSGKIIWCGEAVDLAEAAGSYFSGKLDLDVQRDIALALDELQTLMRDNSERRTEQVTRSILAKEPGHAGALRMRCFVLENSNRVADAWALLIEQINAAPDLARLYFTSLDMIIRHRELEKELPSMLAKFRASVKDGDMQLAMAWNLLRLFDLNAVAVKEAAAIIDAAAEKSSVRYETVAALFSYRIGDLDAAVEHQEKALSLLPGKDNPRRAELESFGDFYRRMRDLKNR